MGQGPRSKQEASHAATRGGDTQTEGAVTPESWWPRGLVLVVAGTCAFGQARSPPPRG